MLTLTANVFTGKCYLSSVMRILFPTNIYLFKENKRDARGRCEICSKLTMKTLERDRCSFGVLIVDFEHISHVFQMFP